MKRLVSKRLAWGLLGAALAFPVRAITPAVVTPAAPIGRKVSTPTPTPTNQYGKGLLAVPTPTPTPTTRNGTVPPKSREIVIGFTGSTPAQSREIVIGFTGSTPAQSREIRINFVGKPASPFGVPKT